MAEEALVSFVTEPTIFGGVEAGGTNTVCVVGSGQGDVADRLEFGTTTPEATIQGAVRFFAEGTGHRIAALGLGWFGPLEIRRGHSRYGVVGRTPKPGWEGADVVSPFREALGVPVAVDTDVAAAALAEGEWGAAQGLASHVYLTVGTGIGGGAIVDGFVLHGLGHPEMGHLPVVRADGDDFTGVCPFHGACLEGMASGPAIEGRWGRPAEDLGPEQAAEAADLVASYLAQGLRAVTYVVAPQRIVVGGGVARLPGFLAALRRHFAGSLAGYPGLSEHAADDFVSAARLGDMAGPLGGLVLARRALGQPGVLD
jgi:fructokinase